MGCEKMIALNKIRINPPLFKHFGRYSSLSGKEQLRSREILENRKDTLLKFKNETIGNRYFMNQFPVETDTSIEIVLPKDTSSVFVIYIQLNKINKFDIQIQPVIDNQNSTFLLPAQSQKSVHSDKFLLKRTIDFFPVDSLEKQNKIMIAFDNHVQINDFYIYAI